MQEAKAPHSVIDGSERRTTKIMAVTVVTLSLVWLLFLAAGRPIAAQEDPCVCLEQFGTEDLHNPTFMTTAPGDDERIFVGEQPGLLWVYSRDGTRNPEPFLDVSDRIELRPTYDERGLLGMTFHPDFQNNRKFYVYFSQTVVTPENTRLAEFMTDENNPDVADMSTERVIMEFEQPAANHNGGEVCYYKINQTTKYYSRPRSVQPDLIFQPF